MRPTVLGLMLITAAGCGDSGTQPVALDAPLRLKVDGATAGMARVHVEGASGIVTPSGPVIASVGGDASAGASSDLAFAPTSLALDLRSNGDHVSMGDLRLPLGDLRLFAPSLPAEGLQLRDLVVQLPTTRMEIARKTADLLSLYASTAELSLAWKLELPDGSRYALGALPIGPLEVHVAVAREDDGSLSLQWVAMCPDTCGGVDGLFTIDDGLIWTRSTAVAAAP